ncbi:MAG TPA: AAA family ATPase [Actinomycetota bacterium]|nr:AAA family ATPase [Actinomycetota bacterium]
MPVCARCGEDNPARARFCLACAAPLTASERGWREERKRVSVLFCDLVGFTSRAEQLDVEDVRGLLDPYYRRLKADLERHGGTVEKFIGDAVVALFGAPVAHEDDPERAVRAALAVRDAIAELNERDPSLDLHVRLGVTTGEALVALAARPVEGEGMASGDVVNTAARLQAAAPVDGILVDEATFRATGRWIDYEQAEPVAAKGKAAPVQVWLALSPRASLGVDVAQAPTSALVGRGRELEVLAGALARVRSEQSPQLVTLVGVPGMGKSRLVWELLQTVEAEADTTIWRQGRCLPYGDGVALWALGEVVKAQAGILDSDPAEGAEAKLIRAVGDLVGDQAEAAWATGLLGPLVGLGGAAEPGEGSQAEAFAAWRRFLEALAEQGPTVLVVEDLHWADELLLDFLDHLVDWAAEVPLLVVATARPELLTRRPGWGGGKPNSTTVSLAPLSEADTARLVAGLLGQALLPAEVQTALLTRAGGNPLFAEEYVRMLADREYLRKVAGSWRLEQADALPLPETVQGIIAARLDALHADEKELLQAAAVLGKVGWLGALAALSGAEPGAVERRLHVLERRELVRRERRSQVAGERQYAFRHVLIRDVAYGQLPRAARADRHRRAAEWLQQLAPDRAEDRAELLAHHWQAALAYATATGQDTAGLGEPARLAFREAGDRALALHAFAAAARWYRAALEQWPPGDRDRPRLLLELARALFEAEEAGPELLEEARDGLLAQGDLEGAAEAEWMLGDQAELQGRGDRAFTHVRRAVALLDEARPSPVKAWVLYGLSSLLIRSSEYVEAIEVGRQALAMAEALGLASQQSRVLSMIGIARVNGGDTGGIADLERSVAVAQRANLPEAGAAYGNLAGTLATLGDLGRAFELQAEGRRVAERFGSVIDQRWLQIELAWQDYTQGRWDAAVDGIEQFLAAVQAGSPHFAEGPARQLRGLIRLGRGDLTGALADARDAVAFAGQRGDPQLLLSTLAFHGHVLLAGGRAGEAAARADEVLAILAEQGAEAAAPDWTRELGVVLFALGRAGELVKLAGTVNAPTPWLEAAAAMASGDFERAAATYARIGSLPDEAYARLRAAEQLVAAGHRVEANQQLERAVAFYRQVRATGYLRAGEELLAASA